MSGCVEKQPEPKFERGDIVHAVAPFVLYCGTGIYDCAVVARARPLVLVSEAGDMLWHRVREDQVEWRVKGSNRTSVPAAFMRYIYDLERQADKMKALEEFLEDL